MTTTIPEFRPAQGFVFQSNFQNEKERDAYDKTLDAALDEIDTNAFRIPAQSGLTVPNPCGRSFKSDILSIFVENLCQHEMPSGGELWYRAYDADEPVRGLRIEFWGAGMHPLPSALTARPWFTARNRPWAERVAPIDATQEGSSHTALSDLFDSVEEAELAEVVYFGWRKADEQEGPFPNGHIIALHFTVVSNI